MHFTFSKRLSQLFAKMHLIMNDLPHIINTYITKFIDIKKKSVTEHCR